MNDKVIEDYFIQFYFCGNREVLRRENRELYDALFIRYKKTHKAAKEMGIVDLNLINKKFANDLIKGLVNKKKK